MKSLHSIAAILALFALTGSALAQPAGVHSVEVAVLTPDNWDRLVPAGKEVDAILGDVVLRNQHLCAVIARPVATRHANMTVRDVGGCLIDFTSREFESDQLSCFYPGQREFPYSDWKYEDHSGVTRPIGDDLNAIGSSIAVVVTAPATDSRPAVSTIYRLESGAKHLELATQVHNTSQRALRVGLHDGVRADGANEDMRKAPDGTGPIFWIDDRYWQQAYGLLVGGDRRGQWDSSSRESKIEYLDQQGSHDVELAPGDVVEIRRQLVAGRTRMHVTAALAPEAIDTFRSCSLSVRDATDRQIPGARITVKDSTGELGSAVCDARGQTQFPLAAGDYTLSVAVNGISVVEDRPLQVMATGASPSTIVASEFQPGTLVARVIDESGTGIPCKTELIPQDRTPKPDFGPISATYAVRNLRYAPHGEFRQDLHPGRYDVIISRGPEYDAVFTTVDIHPGEITELSETLVRSVDTTGWVSSDFHSHSTPSGDNTSHQLGRVLNLVCEHVEFAPCTEHNRIDTYVPHIESLDIGSCIATCSGMELTGSPLPLNHQNAFPLHHHPHTQDGGAPITDVDPERQIERLMLWDNRSDKLIQQNHPDLGWLFYDRDGDTHPDAGFQRSFGLIDVIEVHPLPPILRREQFTDFGTRKENNCILNWLQLLNQGHRIPGVVNTDAHYNYHGSDWLRNWIQSSTDDPGEIETLEMVHSAEEGRLIMSNGPFLEVTAAARDSARSVTVGQDLASADGRVQLNVRVQCPNWHDINRVFVLVNGRPHSEHDYRRDLHPARFSAGVVKFNESLTITLENDAHLIVVAGGEGLQLGPVVGPDARDTEPTAVSNPIYVDIDGGGFTPNKDTLGHPLPTRHVDR